MKIDSKTIIQAIIAVLILSAIAVAADLGGTNLTANPGKATLMLPTVSANTAVIPLGRAFDKKSKKNVDGFAIIHRKKNPSHKPNHNPGGRGGKDKGGSKCFAFIAKGAKWKGAPEPWVMNPNNSVGVSPAYAFANMKDDIAKWEDAATGAVNGSSLDIVGNGTSVSTTLVADTVQPDGANEVYFGFINDSNTIAVTIVWGIFSGPPGGRQLVEWDQVYNTSYPWSETGEAGKMDFENIATHELGHTFGLGDLYTADCTEETMYGFSGFGEVKKSTLEGGDIKGISSLY